MRNRGAGILAGGLVCALTAPGTSAEQPPRPRVLGVAHAAFRVSDLAKARAFYERLLGLAVEPSGDGFRAIVNARQSVIVLPGLDAARDRLDHLALRIEDLDAVARVLATRGPRPGPKRDEAGGPALRLSDPEGWTIEFAAADPPRSAASSRAALSLRILHAGLCVRDLEAMRGFYGGLLGFSETWGGGHYGLPREWTNMKVPDGDDYIEFVRHATLPPADARATANHICLEVPDIRAAKKVLERRLDAIGYTRPLEVRVVRLGANRYRQLDLFDPDGTRVELMEPRTVDGQPIPPSAVPPPAR